MFDIGLLAGIAGLTISQKLKALQLKKHNATCAKNRAKRKRK